MRVRGQQTVSGVGLPATEKQGIDRGVGCLRLKRRAAWRVTSTQPWGSIPMRCQQPEDAADSQLGEVGQGRAQVRRADRRQAQDPPLPGWVGEQPACVEAPHAMTDHVDRLIRKCLEDLLAEAVGPLFDAGDRGHAGDEHSVSRRGQELRNRAEVGSERDAARGRSA